MVKKIICFFSIFVFLSVYSSSNQPTLDFNDSRFLRDFYNQDPQKLDVNRLEKDSYVHEWMNDPYQKSFIDLNRRLHFKRVLLDNRNISFDLYLEFLERYGVLMSKESISIDIEELTSFLVEEHLKRIRKQHRDFVIV